MSISKGTAVAAVLIAAGAIAPTAAHAEWWNPFKRAEQQRQQPLPAPPAAGQGQFQTQQPFPQTAQPQGAQPQATQPQAAQPGANAQAYPNTQGYPGTEGYPGTQGFPNAQGGSPAAAEPLANDPASRMERVEAKMRELTGKVEELTYELRQLRQQVGGGTGQQGAAPASGRFSAAAESDEVDDEAPLGGAEQGLFEEQDQKEGDGIGAAIQGGGSSLLGAPPRTLGTLPVSADAGPLDLGAVAGRAGRAGTPETVVAAVAPAATGNPRQDYEAAYGRVVAGDYDVAETQLRGFLAAYPDDALAADARYWLGESLYTRGMYREAADQFLDGYRSHPKSGKAPDTLLKLGMSLSGLGQRDAACATYSELLKKYPDTSNALKQRVEAEQKSASC